MQQQARNAGMWAEDEGINLRFLIHDRDSKFSEAFDEHFRRDDGGPVRTPPGAPIANCYAESWIGSLKRECLNHFFCFNLKLVDHIVQTYADYHNKFRPHQGLGNRPPGASRAPWPMSKVPDPPSVESRSWLGGLLKHYERRAA